MGFSGICSRLIRDLLKAIGGASRPTSPHNLDHQNKPISKQQTLCKNIDESMVSALITVFGMKKNGRIKKEKAQQVVEKLGLIIYSEEEKAWFELKGHEEEEEEEDEVQVKEVIGDLEEEEEEEGFNKRNELLHEAFKIFDVDGDGFIDVMELKRVLECLGLDNGWEISEIEKMVRVVDVNLDGKVDFTEFELMMGVKCS